MLGKCYFCYSFIFEFSDYRAEWERIKVETEKKKKEEEQLASELDKDNTSLLTAVPAGIELSDVYLRNPAGESSEDSEGEEEPYSSKTLLALIIYLCYLHLRNCLNKQYHFFLDVIDVEEENAFKKVLVQQREMQIKRAKEAEVKKKAEQPQTSGG